MKALILKSLTEKGRLAINEENSKNKLTLRKRASIKASGGKIEYIDGGIIFQHFLINMIPSGFNGADNAESRRLKKAGFAKIEEALESYGCEIGKDYSVEIEEVKK